MKNVVVFDKLLFLVVISDQVLPEFAKQEILQHLIKLENEFKGYFSELSN